MWWRSIAGWVLVAVAAPQAAAATYVLSPDQTAVGATAIYFTRSGDTLMELARAFNLGFTELRAANRGIDNPWEPGVGPIVVPSWYLLPDAPRHGIVLNLAAQRLYYFPPSGDAVESFPIGVGIVGRKMPRGATTVVAKVEKPTWRPPPSIRAERPELPAAVPPGPDNPLGDYAFRLGWERFLIHGTNKPWGVGRTVSHGCVHLYPEDMEHLFREVPVGTPVHVLDREVETAWIGQRLYIAVYRDPAQAEDLAVMGEFTPRAPRDLEAIVKKAAGSRRDSVDWAAVRRAGIERSGLPVPVTPMPRSSPRLVTEPESEPALALERAPPSGSR